MGEEVLITRNKIAEVGQLLNVKKTAMKKILELEVSTDPYDKVVLEALKVNGDAKLPLYQHQYEALYALGKGKDVLLIYPCGSGKTRVLINGLAASALGLKYRGVNIDGEPLCIINTPLNSIMEEKIGSDASAGMITGAGKVKTNSEDVETFVMNKPEELFFDGTLKRVYGHPESFTSSVGQKILEKNQERIVLHASDELAQYLWGPEFRKLGLQVVPGCNRLFAVENSPFLAMTATLKKPEEILEAQQLLGMKDRECEVIACNPVKLNPFYSTILRPSNQTPFYDSQGLLSLLRTLFLDSFIENPYGQETHIVFGRQEQTLAEIYNFLESKMEVRFPNIRTRPFVQYHGATDEMTLSTLHKRIKDPKGKPIKLFLATDKLKMGVDIEDVGVVIFIRPPNTFHSWEQGCGRARGGKGDQLGSKKTVAVVLYNKEDLKTTVDGLSDPMRDFCKTDQCLKKKSANFFGYNIESNLNSWCCVNCSKRK